ncbi:MAG: hypothetical protein DBW91_04465 [Candidatus Thioglobus sp.]|nr:MAG: hypothetical protein DBW91_04465 [Candidatus Thioglobus sp.]|tara:strand:+ start:2264 stop:2758 length:495 start_codon:yes stop_codon:yes gene_type:complete
MVHKKILSAWLLISSLLLAQAGYAAEASIEQESTDLSAFVHQQLATDRWDLVMFWATNCEPCKKDFQKLARLMEDYPAIAMSIIGVVIDGQQQPQIAAEIIRQRNLNYPHVLTNYETANTFHTHITQQALLGTPSYLLYDHNNVMVAANPSIIDIDALLMFVED